MSIDYQLPDKPYLGTHEAVNGCQVDIYGYTADQMQAAYQAGRDSMKAEWVGLTDDEWEPLYDKFAKHQEYGAFVSGWGDFAKAIEAKLKEKNT